MAIALSLDRSIAGPDIGTKTTVWRRLVTWCIRLARFTARCATRPSTPRTRHDLPHFRAAQDIAENTFHFVQTHFFCLHNVNV